MTRGTRQLSSYLQLSEATGGLTFGLGESAEPFRLVGVGRRCLLRHGPEDIFKKIRDRRSY